MSLRDSLNSFFDNVGLKSKFETKPRDAAKARQSLLRGIEKTRDQFENGKTKAPGKWWQVSNDVVAFSPTLSGVALVINGQTTNHLEAENFPGFLNSFRAAVEAGEFDKEIEQIESGSGNAGSSVKLRVPTGQGRSAPRRSRLEPRADNLPHRVEGYKPSPHASYVMNKAGTYWRSPEQVAHDESTSAKRNASLAKKR